MLNEPVTGASAWRGADLAHDDSWIWTLDATECRELEAAVSGVARRGLRAGEFEREDFPLEQLAARLAHARAELEDGRGFVLLRGLPLDGLDERRLLQLYWGLGVWTGRPMPQRAVLNLSGIRDDLIAHVTDQGHDIRKRNVHGSATRADQLPHVDPADVVGLLCVRRAKSGGVSHIASAATVYNELLARHPEYLPILRRGFHLDLRDEVRDGVDARVTPQRAPVFSHHAGKLSVNFNARMIRTGQEQYGEPLDAIESAAVDAVIAIARAPEIRLEMDFRPGDMQLLNNYAILHSRTGWEDHPEPERRRLLLRLWLNVPDARALIPGFDGDASRVAKHDIMQRTVRAS